MAEITKDQVAHIANLARLNVTEEETSDMQQTLEGILNFCHQIDAVDTENVKPTHHVLDLQNVLREDVAGQGLPQEKVLSNAKEVEAGQFKVPAVMNWEDA
ncbi:Asp-tRNA(Asn)/Glu-tRNA(Gln) amidotransferase subunit GatC [Staphylococcus schleiferi]|uniref:Asp-tRNA(Asn)/Glu-tRNA(Gln) amidotransferase subunit GatC n=1 Tax=Staphylococcus schleiferi TaxID=1295 RepID=UPI001887C87F|nr:Asp-tRNA(Asn)/Glu-tRNA(Gln) amidotransferase subunit GatC [Staphylococcus schleiferi]MBF1992357.1 Asp-tRNA(Asn)/Glu-tRNA(Gln) amidotransferase subunit GatC [Staphylococcus schleiferi]MBF2038051.1 Asp-tRNA(Asn)/Glu-tRNA(Gln) amidotransferase subunit GatC [Staphylococcus schleiferi]MBF2099855.1 Asp-tRNA(Asn)/Glu-tRNA(Gln) amidotransferase subunit GatC [Staphylococcus schleiferi]MBF2102195.1 Asp-tRNA(Asn)/Glu-tRNA(Gln) amidotransferase subunit GatC [Staphylococcus schleiferi]MBF2104322.1 Asp-t